ncbi:Naphthalene 1,2-dioxygenase/salicylate 5-hydroxylase systems, ferredoxin component [Roseivivax jejudonensis]|uniref:Naphthalene 1,2-dioxygenase/salicylate 5-hydroxylase systems, ferredoxin component n=1 Tax=Roseivivax jejudonensis TaxID=1529041 RepID=A0A1X6Y473_9RHOB|nr:Rieske 2Fe-2S domain-containing protein [Roseivivax jejudonensis]SLN10369.1 Naphthalene 1,2-dioxygenase/salicylate 5-hydroxylase systems, ferredoxin component [Roseivivax jejudonensis]
MSVRYIPVQWNRFKWGYDAALLASVGVFLWAFLRVTPEDLGHERDVSGAIRNARAFGACAFVMLTGILCIGPLARLDTRFLPLLYNRRHFGVVTAAVALTHFSFVLDWYFAFSPAGKYEALLFANTSFTNGVAGFPFEAFGIFALLSLLILAATSHDFWMKFLTPPVWKGLHYLIYPAYAAVVAHVAWGALLDQENTTFAWVVHVGALLVVGLHLGAALSGRDAAKPRTAGWVDAGDPATIPEGRARIVTLASGDRVAVFRHEGALSAISNACAHQNGPLGEGRIIDCLVTCPWHGFQYDVRTGRSPAPFTEKVPTYALRLEGGRLLVSPDADPPGTPQRPVPVHRGRTT